MNTTLLDSLTDCLQEHEKSIKDILWIGSEDLCIPIENFSKLAIKIPERFSSDDMPTDVVVVGKDFWIERVFKEPMYGLWEYKTFPQKPHTIYPVRTLNFRSFTEEEDAELLKARKARYDQTHLQEDSPYNSDFKLWMMLYKK